GHRDEAAFAALLRRHSKLVWGVCRRILGHDQEAEDAFQATFLVLARKADSIRKAEALPAWLYGVAQRTAMTARKTTSRRRKRERQVGTMARNSSYSEPALRELQVLLDDELSRL